MGWLRDNASYIIAAIAGILLVQFLAMSDAWAFILSHRMKFLFVIAASVLLIMVWLLKTDLPRRDSWVIAEIVIIVIMLPVVVGSGTLVYEEQSAWKGEEIHWHADFAVIVDGEEYDLIDPHLFCGGDYLCNLGNHTGGSNLHEHGDKRIHIHGPVASPEDATLGAFFETFQGTLTGTELRFPTNDGWVNRTNTAEKTLKVLVQSGTYGDRHWEHLDDPTTYIISPYTKGPVDRIVFAYDNVSVQDALQDVRSDGRYRGIRVG